MAGGEGESTKKRAMVAIDESECSHHALDWALANLRDSLSSPLIIFTVQPLQSISILAAASYGSPAPELIRSVQEHQQKVSVALLEKAKEICSERGVVAETITEVGDPKEAICQAVEKFDVNLLILGNQGKGTLQRAFLGSVSNYCVHNAKCPVLVVKKSE
ncbi:universal stress protein A-like protein [Phoenix dactylifera]|uniref:Universal stress protein A-like protein n=1 Tax=Phoenix dactylifera TaxID=42345 RepID=A0A8B7CF59_PHODC|nr:universal stress protein A-like protein [Phoenix dactylifera]